MMGKNQETKFNEFNKLEWFKSWITNSELKIHEDLIQDLNRKSFGEWLTNFKTRNDQFWKMTPNPTCE